MSNGSGSELTEQELFTQLGVDILRSSKMGTLVSDAQKAQVGRNWFKGHLGDIRAAVCGNSSIEDLATKGDTTALVAAVTPLLNFSPTAAAATTIAVLLARIGLRSICAGQWS
jgi:hypothetical protein